MGRESSLTVLNFMDWLVVSRVHFLYLVYSHLFVSLVLCPFRLLYYLFSLLKKKANKM